jgi:hypothetical protein
MKSNYGARAGKMIVEWRGGLFVPVDGQPALDAAAEDAKAEDVFMTILKRLNQQARNASDKLGANYAPALFAKESEAEAGGVSAKQLASAMVRLFSSEKIKVEITGSPSRRTRMIMAWNGAPSGGEILNG